MIPLTVQQLVVSLLETVALLQKRVVETVGYLTGRLGISQRDTQEVLKTVCHTDLGLGSVPALEQAVSEALAQAVADAQAYVQTQPVANVDETSRPERQQPAWRWVSACPFRARSPSM